MKGRTLYHGTRAGLAPQILARGIRPRSATGEDNWSAYKSREDMVYLTSAYPFYFAVNAATGAGEDRAAVFEVASDRLDAARLYPDEDFVAQIVAAGTKRELEKVHPQIRENLEAYRDKWALSLTKMGTLCHRGPVPTRAITRYAVVDLTARPQLWLSFADPCITWTNYLLRGRFYENFVAWVFGDRDVLPHVDDALQSQKNWRAAARSAGSACEEAEELERNVALFEKSVDHWSAESRNRKGIEIVTV